jgi:hypothetical protein
MELAVWGAVNNRGKKVVDTELYASQLLVDGETSQTWSWAIGNGTRDEREFALEPLQTVEFSRLLPASSLLPDVGRHELVLVVRGCSSPVTVVERF